MKRGVASSLALLASIMILTTQVCINIAFVEVINEEVVERARGIVEEAFKPLNLVIATNGSSLVVINGQDCELSISSLSLYYLDGDVAEVEVDWCVPGKSVSIYQVPEVSEGLATCVAVRLTLREGGGILLPLNKA